jgi:ORF6N domain
MQSPPPAVSERRRTAHENAHDPDGTRAKVSIAGDSEYESPCSSSPDPAPGAMTSLAPAMRIGRAILVIRGLRVMLDADLAGLYGVTTKRLNEQVKRNRDRFPADFMFQLTAGEKAEVVAHCDHLRRLRFSPVLPYAFTEHGAVMLASVLNSTVAVHTSIQIVRAFVRLRAAVASHTALAGKLDELERKYDAQFKVVFEALRKLMAPPPSSKRIGFLVGRDR